MTSISVPGAVDIEASLPTIEKVVLQAVADALDVKVDEIELDTSLQEDLQSESLDLLDISFRLERAFQLRLPRTNLMEQAEEYFGVEALVKDGFVTDLGLRLLQSMRPEIDASRFARGLRASDVRRFVTPRTFVRLVLRLLQAKAEYARQLVVCPECQANGTISAADNSPEFVCSACSAIFPVPAGDDVLLADIRAKHESGLFSARQSA